jgi:hypothetical protein
MDGFETTICPRCENRYPEKVNCDCCYGSGRILLAALRPSILPVAVVICAWGAVLVLLALYFHYHGAH